MNCLFQSESMTTQPPQSLHTALSPATTSTTVHRWRLVKYTAIATFLLVHLVATGFAVVPGYLSIDEAIYHWMVKNLADGRGVGTLSSYRITPLLSAPPFILAQIRLE